MMIQRLFRFRCALPLVFSISLFSVSAFAEPARIAAWNVASGRNNKGATPIPADRLERIGTLVATKIKPDVLVLEEVWPASASADIAKAATAAGFPMEAVEVPSQDSQVVQLVTILKRPGVEVKDVSLIDQSNDLVKGDDPEEKTTRKAVLATVKVGKFDFYLIGVHLKSKRPSKTLHESPMEMRDRQCQVISDKIDSLVSASSEKDALLIGDFNMTPDGQANEGEEADGKNFATLDSHHELRFISSESKAKSHVGFFKGKIEFSKLDGYAITHAAEAEYVPGSFRVLNDHVLGVNFNQFTDQKGKDFISDHFPIVAEFDDTHDAD